MTNPLLDELAQEITQDEDVMNSARIFIDGVPDMLVAAREQAIANGATAEQLEPFRQMELDLRSRRESLSAAILANTPSAP
jgi:hypothetical protein